MSLGQRSRQRRKALNITQQEVARVLGVTPQFISLIEQDKATPSLAMLPKLAEELGVTTDFLTTGKESIVTDTIPAIKADKSLKLDVKKLLIGLVQEFRSAGQANTRPDSPSRCTRGPSK